MVSLLTAKGLFLFTVYTMANTVFAADVYVCEKNGRKEFSQLPCGENAVILKTEGDPANLKIIPVIIIHALITMITIMIQAMPERMTRKHMSYLILLT